MNDRIGNNLINALNRVVGGFGDVMSTLARKAVPHIRQRTRRGMDDKGSPFKAYSPKYLRRKRTNVNLYGNRRVTKNQSRMLDELTVTTSEGTGFSSNGGGNMGRFIDPKRKTYQAGSTSSVTIGWNDPKKANIAGYHHLGRTAGNPSGFMPRRPFLGLEPEFIAKEVQQDFQKLVTESFGTAGANERITMRLM
jgi:phage gpG-like protein